MFTGRVISLLSVSLLFQFSNANLGINAPETTITAGQSENFSIYPTDDITDSCSIRLKADSTATEADYQLTAKIGSTEITDLSSFTIGTSSVDFTLTVVADSDTTIEQAELEMTCGSIKISKVFTFNPAPGGSGDPHFMQTIFDHRSNKSQIICYDVVGNSDQFIQIYSDSKRQTKLVGQLKDDYYMHKIFAYLIDNQIEATTDHISLPMNLRVKWNEMVDKQWLQLDNIYVKFDDNFVNIKLNSKDEISFGIKRNKDNVGKYYLDAFVYGLMDDYSGKDGLLGRIGQNKISIYSSIQDAKGEESRKTVVINNKKSVGYEMKRNGISCTLVDVESLLYPFKLNSYIHD